jgi:hypothetical protein
LKKTNFLIFLIFLRVLKLYVFRRKRLDTLGDAHIMSLLRKVDMILIGILQPYDHTKSK